MKKKTYAISLFYKDLLVISFRTYYDNFDDIYKNFSEPYIIQTMKEGIPFIVLEKTLKDFVEKIHYKKRHCFPIKKLHRKFFLICIIACMKFKIIEKDNMMILKYKKRSVSETPKVFDKSRNKIKKKIFNNINDESYKRY
jgi:hypothetical protein